MERIFKNLLVWGKVGGKYKKDGPLFVLPSEAVGVSMFGINRNLFCNYFTYEHRYVFNSMRIFLDKSKLDSQTLNIIFGQDFCIDKVALEFINAPMETYQLSKYWLKHSHLRDETTVTDNGEEIIISVRNGDEDYE